MTLADALWYAQEKCAAKKIVDIATLTGAQMVALGTEIAAVLSPKDEVYAALESAAKASGASCPGLPAWTTSQSATGTACCNSRLP